jgi:hypothetical protein
MRIKIISLVGCLLVALLGFGVLAENGGESGNDPKDKCPLGIIEGPDPIGFADCFSDAKVSVSGKVKTGSKTGADVPPSSSRSVHGRPDFGRNAQSGQPFMVWADRNANEHDIAFSAWVDSGWGRVEYLTSSFADEHDPRAFAAADGSVYVSWWTDGVTPQVHVSRRDPDTGSWTHGRQVAANASLPTIAVVDGRVWVAFERESELGLRHVVVASESPSGEFVERIVAASDRKQSLDVELHLDEGRLWLDWKQSGREFGFAEWLDGRWSGVTTEPWVDHSWAGEQQSRRRIRDGLLSR